MGSGLASSVLIADGVVAHDGVAPVVAGVLLARRARRGVHVARVRAIVYNVVAVGAAMAGFVNPLVAALLMPLSSLAVGWEASRVGSFDPDGGHR